MGGAIISFLIWLVQAVLFGAAVQKIIDGKGYYENWFWWGFFFGIWALLAALIKPDNSAAASSSSYAMYNQRAQTHDTNLLESNGWKCRRCGRVNPAYTGTCGCGMTRLESERPVDSTGAGDGELSKLAEIKALKELLDGGAITQEEFDAKRKQLLNI